MIIDYIDQIIRIRSARNDLLGLAAVFRNKRNKRKDSRVGKRTMGPLRWDRANDA
jgi:hypothetical protein